MSEQTEIENLKKEIQILRMELRSFKDKNWYLENKLGVEEVTHRNDMKDCQLKIADLERKIVETKK